MIFYIGYNLLQHGKANLRNAIATYFATRKTAFIDQQM
jgi:hypothetical protein